MELVELSKFSEDYNTIMKYIWDRLNSKNKQWRRILKTLNLIEHLLLNGAKRCIGDFKDEIYKLRTLRDF